MNDWMGDKSNSPLSAAKRPVLPVLAPPVPSSPLSTKRASKQISDVKLKTGSNLIAAKETLIALQAGKVGESTIKLLPVTGLAAPGPPVSPGAPPLSFGEVDLNGCDKRASEEGDQRWLTDFAFFYGIPSWLVSFVFHLILIIILALLSFANNQGKHIEFVLANEMMPNAIETMDVSIDLSVLETEAEDLQQESEVAELNDDFEAMFNAEVEPDANGDLLAEQLSAIDALDSSSFEFKRGDGKGASFFGTGAIGTQFVFVVDCSGSMGDEYRWIMARRELKEAIMGLTEEQQFFVFLYNDSSFAYTKRKPKLISATKQNKEKIFKWLDSQSPIGDTRPWGAMRSSLGLKPNAVFLLSDGELKDDTVQLLREENVERVRNNEKIGKIPIHTISLGSGFGSETMRAISDQNDGTFTHVNTW